MSDEQTTTPGAVDVTPSGRYPGQILGYRNDGRPIRVIAGGSGEGAPAGGDGGGGESGGAGGAGGTGGADPAGQPGNDPGGSGGSEDGTGGTPPAGGTGGDNGGSEGGTGQPAGRPVTPPAKRPLEEFPEDIREYVKDLRKQAGDGRVAAKNEKARADQVEQKLQSFLDGFADVLGLAPKTPEQELTPEQLTAQLTGAREDHRKTVIELAALRQALKAEADGDALLDSRSFTDRIHKLDPTAEDFGSQLAEAITTAVEDNPRFRAGRHTPAEEPPSGGQFGGGPGGQADPGSMSVEDHLRLINKARGLS